MSWQLLNQYLHLWGRSVAALSRPGTWGPFALMFAAQSALLALLFYGVRRPWSRILEPLPDWILPAGFFEYPAHLLLVPSVLYNRFIPVLGLFAESLLFAAATWIFVRLAQGQPLPGLAAAVAKASPRYGQLVFFYLLNFVLLFAYHELYQLALGGLWQGFPRRRLAIDLAGVGLGAGINSLLAFSTVIIVVEGTRTTDTLRHALRTLFRHPLSTWTTVFVGTLFTVPFSWALGSAHEWIARFNPEVLMVLTGASLVVGSLASFLIVGMLTFWYLLHRRPL